MSKPTPGPWSLVLSNNATPHVLSGSHFSLDDLDTDEISDSLVCIMPVEITCNHNSLANARLIAAAPELLEALIEMNRLASGPTGGVTQSQKVEIIAKSTAAIDKATGSES